MKKQKYIFKNTRGYYLQHFDEGVSLATNLAHKAYLIIGTKEFAEGAKFILEKLLDESFELIRFNLDKQK
jgi:hypothetical protein